MCPLARARRLSNCSVVEDVREMVDIAELRAKYPKQTAKYDPAEAFRQLINPDPAIRLLGAKWLAKQAHGEVNNFTEYWLKDSATMDRLLPLLDDPDPLVVEQLIGVVNMLASPRYGNKDKRIIPRALPLLKSDRPNTRTRAVLCLTNFEDESLADPLLMMFADPDKSVRSIVVREIPALQWSQATRERVRLAALERLGDRVVEVRCAAAMLLITVGKQEDVETLKKGLKGIKGVNWRQEYRESMGLLEQRLRVQQGTLPEVELDASVIREVFDEP